MSRNFVKISLNELKKKINESSEDERLDYRRLTPTVEKDLDKIRFDTENMGAEDDRDDKGFLGYYVLSNGMPFLGVYAGGDWENPVYFIIYWDGKKLMGYIPEDGNLYNTDTKQAYGNDEKADLKNAQKRWPADKALQLEDHECFDSTYLDNYDYAAMKKDIMERILEKPLTKAAKSSKLKASGLQAYSDAELLAELKRRKLKN